MKSETELPDWLHLVLRELKASYKRKLDKARSNLSADEQSVHEYLGTYFPRSYCEVFCIAENLFQNTCYRTFLTNDALSDKVIDILDIGCGTGGDIVGLLSSINQYLPLDVRINVCAFDGNITSLVYMEKVIDACRKTFKREITVDKTILPVNSEEDLSVMVKMVENLKFDYILCCKMCNELKSDGFIKQPYLSVAEKFSAKLKHNGIMLILDPTDRPKENYPYLPREMNYELNSFASSHVEFGTLVPKPCGELPQCNGACYMQKQFTITNPGYLVDSSYPGDTSKVCYRIICSKVLRDQLIQGPVLQKKQVIHPNNQHGHRVCRRSEAGNDEVDAFDLNAK